MLTTRRREFPRASQPFFASGQFYTDSPRRELYVCKAARYSDCLSLPTIQRKTAHPGRGSVSAEGNTETDGE